MASAALCVPDNAAGIQLHRIVNEELISCEPVLFERGAAAVDTVLRRASVSGAVSTRGELGDYFADILDANGDMLANVALDREAYSALKNHWMRCRIAA